MITVLATAIKYLSLIVPLLLSVAVFTLLERKVLAAMQRRRGPNVVGPKGLLQPLADGLKLFIKEITIPSKSNKFLLLFAPILSLTVSLLAWIVMPISEGLVIVDIDLGILWILLCSSTGVYGIILAGWASNSKFSFLGAIRSVSQMVSYEVTLSIILLQVIILSQSTNLSTIIHQQSSCWYILPLFPFFILWTVSTIAETNRPPFDLPEAEAELVAGYFVDYSALGFAMYQIAEYSNIILMSALTTVLFLGGHLPVLGLGWIGIPGIFWFLIKAIAILFLFLWVRATFPRYRYDQLMSLTWRTFLPLTLAGLIATSLMVYYPEGFLLPIMTLTGLYNFFHGNPELVEMWATSPFMSS